MHPNFNAEVCAKSGLYKNDIASDITYSWPWMFELKVIDFAATTVLRLGMHRDPASDPIAEKYVTIFRIRLRVFLYAGIRIPSIRRLFKAG